MNNKIENRILCAAIYYDDGIKRAQLPRNIKSGIVACGLRHGNCFTVLTTMFPDRDYINKTKQGFLTSDGDFVDRKEGSKIAFEAKQIKKDDGCLFSEDLY